MSNDKIENKIANAYERVAPDLKDSIIADVSAYGKDNVQAEGMPQPADAASSVVNTVPAREAPSAQSGNTYRTPDNSGSSQRTASPAPDPRYASSGSVPPEPVKEKKAKKSSFGKILAIAAALLVVVGGIGGYSFYNSHYTVASTVSLDVNPSIEITVSRDEDVIDVTPLNEEAAGIIGDMDFKGSDLDVTVNALVGSMLTKGYISEIENSILISVDGKDAQSSQAILDELTREVGDVLSSKNINGAVLTQSVTMSDEISKLMELYGITAGKAELVQSIAAKDNRYTTQELAGMTINELNLLLNSRDIVPDTVTSTGNASDGAYIGESKAKTIAFGDAGVSQSSARYCNVTMDFDDGIMVYDVDFASGGYEYDYEINATNGAIVGHSRERDEYYGRGGYAGSNYQDGTNSGSGSNSNGGSGSNSGSTAGNGNGGGSSQSSGKSSSGSYISSEKAKTIALQHAGLKSSSVNYIRAKLDRDDGRTVYEVEFRSGGYEYDYEIDAATGRVIGHDKDRDD